MTRHPPDVAEGICTLGGGIEVPCTYRFYVSKKSKAEFINKLSKSINIRDNKLVFIVTRCRFSAFRQ